MKNALYGAFFVEEAARLNYPSLMRNSILIVLLVLANATVMAGVYKSIGPDGLIQYTDRPMSGAEALQVQQTPSEEKADSAQETASSSADPGPYEDFEIVSPETEDTIRSDKGALEVSLLLSPALLPEHKIRLLIDGQPISGEIPGTQITLNDVTMGTHSLQAQIINELDASIAYTETLTFHMRKPVPERVLP